MINRILYRNFFLFFLVSLFLGLVAQVIGPAISPESFQYGLLKYLKDPILFHEIAVQMVGEMKTFGWSSFSLSPQHQFPSGVLGFIYFFTDISSPVFQILVNSLFFSLSGIVLLSHLKEDDQNNNVKVLIVLGVLVSPTSLQWITQVSKDIYLNFALLLMSLAYLELIYKRFLRANLFFLISFFLIFLVKDHWIEIFFYISILIFPFALIWLKGSKTKLLVTSTLLIASLFFIKSYSFKYHEAPPTQAKKGSDFESIAKSGFQRDKDFSYKGQFFILDKFFNRLAYANYRFHSDHPGRENFEPDLYINSTMAAICYLPKALIFGLFRPFPFETRWHQGIGKGLGFLIIQIEMLLLYMSIFLVFYSWKYIGQERKMHIIVWTLISVVFCVVFVFSTPNLGSVNRYRFPFFYPLKIYGLIFALNLFYSKTKSNLVKHEKQ